MRINLKGAARKKESHGGWEEVLFKSVCVRGCPCVEVFAEFRRV